MKRKTIAALLIIAMIMGLSVPAYAEDTPTEVPEQTQEQPQPQEPEREQTPVVVSTLEELQAAIDAAEDGDIIALSAPISIAVEEGEQLIIGDESKHLRIVLTEDYLSQDVFFIWYGNVIFQNIEFDGLEKKATLFQNLIFSQYENTMVSLSNLTVKNFFNRTIDANYGRYLIDNCLFDNNQVTVNGGCIAINANATVEIVNSTIRNSQCSGSGGAIYNSGTLNIERCKIINNTANNVLSGGNGSCGGIYNNYKCTITDSVISGNVAACFGGISSSGELSVSDTLIYGNIANVACDDLGGKAVVSYSDNYDWRGHVPAGWYVDTFDDRFDGESNITDFCGLELDGMESRNLVFVYEDEITLPEDEDTDTDTDEPTDPDTPPDDPVDGGGDTPEQPTQPEEPEDNGNSGDDTNTPVEPSEPPQDEDSPDDENTPPVIYRPPYRPTRPIAPNPEPEVPVEPEPTPTLVCGEAAIDVSRSIILLGYGDGDLHEEDPLTRAQLATIIYRLLDATSLEKFIVADDPQFADVSPESWCYEYVQTIANAGIVFGVGGGNYNPNGVVTWGQIITVLSRFVEPQEYDLQNIDYDGWALEAVQTAAALGWIEDSVDFSPDDIISRGALVQFVNGILENYRNISEE